MRIKIEAIEFDIFNTNSGNSNILKTNINRSVSKIMTHLNFPREESYMQKTNNSKIINR